MEAVEPGFEKFLCQASSVEKKEAIRNIVVLKKDTLIIPTGFGKSLLVIFQLLRFVFYS